MKIINNTMNLLRYVILVPLTIIIFCSPALAAITITTNAASNVAAGSVTMNGDVTGIVGSATVWFEFSGISSAYLYKTDNQTFTADQAFLINYAGSPLVSGQTYYYRAVGYESGTYTYGAQQSFTTSALSDLADYNFDAHFDNLTNSELEPTNMSRVAASPYIDLFGAIFWGIIYSLIFAMIWMRQEDITIPALLGLIIGASLWAAMPADWTSMAMSLTVISFAGLVYSLIKRGQ